MRLIPLVIVASTLVFAESATAGPVMELSAKNTGSSLVSACSSLKGRLHGLCVAYCAPRNQSNVDMNDIASVRAAAPDLKLLERYNELKTESDPPMLCLADVPDIEPPSPAPTSCSCWSEEELHAIDGLIGSVERGTPEFRCTANESDEGVYEIQALEGYNLDMSTEKVVSSAFAYFDPDDLATQGCMFQSQFGELRNFPLQHRAEAEFCIQQVSAQCAANGQ